MAKNSNNKVERTPVVKNDDNNFIKELVEEVNSTLKREDGTGIMIGESGGDEGVPYWVRTGIPSLDYAVGGSAHPGFPGARFIEIFGGEAAGKSTLAVWLTKMAMEQQGAIAYYQDVERVLTPEIIRGTGIDMKKVMRDQPDTLEEVFDAQEATLGVISKKFSDKPVVITLDSIAACSTKAEIEGDMEDVQMAPHARLMSKGLRKIKSYITDSHVLSIWVNQIRDKMNVSWGDNTATFGGKAMAFYASVRIQVAKVKTLTDSNKNPYGCTIQAVVKKNKVARPLLKAEYNIMFVEDENGSYPRPDIEGAAIDWLEKHDLIEHTTQRVVIEGKSLYREQARKLLLEDRELFQKYSDMAYSVFESTNVEEEEE